MADQKEYPWERLLDSELSPPRPEVKRRRGRPSNPFPRKRRYFSSTDDETKVLDQLVELLKLHFDRNVARGHFIAYMTFYFKRLLENKSNELTIPDDVTSFVELTKYLESK